MSPTSFEPLALRAHRLFESRDLDETRERISRVMQPHALLPNGRTRGASHMDFVRLGEPGSARSRSATRCACRSTRSTATTC